MENENDELADAQERVLKLLKDRFSDRKELKKIEIFKMKIKNFQELSMKNFC